LQYVPQALQLEDIERQHKEENKEVRTIEHLNEEFRSLLWFLLRCSFVLLFLNYKYILPPHWWCLILHHIFSNKIIFKNSFSPWRSLDSSTQHLQISVDERGGFARDDNRLRENNGKEEAAIRNKNFSIFKRFRSNRRFFLPSYTQKTCHPDPASAGEGSPNHYNKYFFD